MNLLFFLFFCILAVILIAAAIGFSVLESQRKKQVSGVLKTVSGEIPETDHPAMLMKRPEDEGAFSRFLRRIDIADKLQARISQSGLEWDVAQLGIVSAVLALVGLFVGLKLNILVFPWLSSFALAAILGGAPYAYVNIKRRQRFSQFEEQFPEALDFLARSMRAGHAFSISLEMLGAESPDPLGREFRALFNEQNLGAEINVALTNLVRRVPLIDVRFFVSAVMLQRQTGGNLSEILTRLGYVIRERFRLRGQVKAASAHGRITAAILTIMPLIVTVALSIIAPDYLKVLVQDPDGRYLIAAAIVAQLLGYYFIRRIVNIKV